MPDLVNADIGTLEERAEHVAERLAEAANAKRLLILCHLAKMEAEGEGEASVGALQGVVGLSQSALSQHLARLRRVGMVATRREGQTIHYRLADDETRALMRALYATFCEPAAAEVGGNASDARDRTADAA